MSYSAYSSELLEEIITQCQNPNDCRDYANVEEYELVGSKPKEDVRVIASRLEVIGLGDRTPLNVYDDLQRHFE